MGIYDFEAAFGSADRTSKAMRQAIGDWFRAYYQREKTAASDPCQRIPYTVVSKLTKAVFGEYRAEAQDSQVKAWLEEMDKVKKQAVQLALMGGSCFFKPCPTGAGFSFTPVARDQVLIFARDQRGRVTDLGLTESFAQGNAWFTLLERRTVDENGYLTIQNRLFRSLREGSLGQQVSLGLYPGRLAERYTYPEPVGSVGLAEIRTPMVNCVDGSADAVAVFAPAMELMEAVDRNEAELSGEFARGQSRILVSADLLDQGQLKDNVFVGLEDDPQTAGITVFSPQLREQSYLARKQEYLRNIESVIGLKRGMLSDANLEERTATEISASNAEYSLTVMELQDMWHQAVRETVRLCCLLAPWYGMARPRDAAVSLDWGNGVLYDEDSQWDRYLEMVREGLLKPEIALGWRFGRPADSQSQQQRIREELMP